MAWSVGILKRQILEEECVTIKKLQESTSHASPFTNLTSNSHPKISPK